MLPPMLGRSDEVHCLYAVAPGLATLGAVLESGATARRPGVGLVAPLLALVLFVLPARDLVPGADAWGRLPFPPPGDRLSGLPRDEREAKQPILDFVAQNVPPGTPIFVGNLQHRLLTFNDTSLYFLTDRPGATRYLQFDPGIVTREDVQRQIVADLEARRPPVAILLDGGYVEEPNESAVPGSPLLDEYLRRRYEAVGSVWRYVLVRRNEP
jgi:hypothetical protein